MVVTIGETVIVTPLNPPGFHVYVLDPVPVIDVDDPEQIDAFVTVVPTAGNGFTVIVLVDVFVQPVAVFVPVTVYVVVAAGVTVTVVPLIPPGFHVYVFAPGPVMLVEVPAHTVALVTVVPTAGNGLTVIVLSAVFVQPVAVFVPVTVYVVVATGVTVTVVPLNPPGFQVYVFAPVPVMLVEVPAHTVAFVTVVPTAGNGLTVIVLVDVFVHPVVVFVPVTVYVVVETGVTVTVVPLNPPGFQE